MEIPKFDLVRPLTPDDVEYIDSQLNPEEIMHRIVYTNGLEWIIFDDGKEYYFKKGKPIKDPRYSEEKLWDLYESECRWYELSRGFVMEESTDYGGRTYTLCAKKGTIVEKDGWMVEWIPTNCMGNPAWVTDVSLGVFDTKEEALGEIKKLESPYSELRPIAVGLKDLRKLK
jgi:hypothetical protein